MINKLKRRILKSREISKIGRNIAKITKMAIITIKFFKMVDKFVKFEEITKGDVKAM